MSLQDGATGHSTEQAELLGDVMSRAARHLREEHGDVEGTLQMITTLSLEVVPQVEGCSISYVIGRRTVEPRAYTSELPMKADLLQQEVGQGPCLDAVWEQEVVRVDDVAADERWPQFGVRAAELGVASMICLQLFVAGDHLGAMNLYSRVPRAFDDEATAVAQMLAAHGAVALAGAQQETNLRRGLDNRDVIGQAKGILMERFKLTADQAFLVLARVSQERNRKLADIARELSETGAVGGTSRMDGPARN